MSLPETRDKLYPRQKKTSFLQKPLANPFLVLIDAPPSHFFALPLNMLNIQIHYQTEKDISRMLVFNL